MSNNVPKRALIIKLSPINGLTSSMMRAMALIKGISDEMEVDFLTVKASATTVLKDISGYEFLNNVNVVYANKNKTYDKIVSPSSEIKKRAVTLIRKAYHALSLYDHTYSIAKNVELSDLRYKDYDYLISVSDPKTSHIAAKELIRQGLTYKKWIEYWGDPMAADITGKSIYPKWVLRISERKLLDHCNSIVYTSPFTLKEQEKLYPAYASRMTYSPTAYMEEKIIPKHEGRFTIGYFGAYYSRVRNIVPLYESCKKLKDTDLIIVGDSDLQLEPTENISIYPRGDISKFEQQSDLFICVLNSSGAQIPGKVYHLAATNRPVLVIVDGEKSSEMEAFFRQFGRYITCRNNEKEITNAIREIICTSPVYHPFMAFSCKEIAKRILDGQIDL